VSKELEYMRQMDITKTKVDFFNKSVSELSSRINGTQITTINLHEIIQIKQGLLFIQDKIKDRLIELSGIQHSYTLANEYFKEMKNADSV
jgi:hypothetical protein